MRRAPLALLLLTACIDYRIGEKDGAGTAPPERDTAVGCPPQLPDCRDSAPPDDSGTPTDPEDCEVIVASERAVEIEEACADTPQAPVADPWSVAVEWQWTGLSTDPTTRQVITTPVIANLTDDNGDGRVDEADIPDIVVSAWGSTDPGANALVALDGATGREHWSLLGYYGWGGAAIVDLDADGVPEVLAFTTRRQVRAHDAQGRTLWTSGQVMGSVSQITAADLDADGQPELLVDRHILSGRTGAVQATLGTAIPYELVLPTAGDLDQDGQQEVIVAGAVYAADGQLLWSSSLSSSPTVWAAILDADGDPEAEVAFVSEGRFGLYEHDGVAIFEVTVGGGRPGPPCVADFDGDGDAEIAWPAGLATSAFELDGAPLWSVPTRDPSGLAGCSGYDVDGDGDVEVLFADEHDLYVLDGATGATLVRESGHGSGTAWETPSVADVDGDGAAEIVVGSNDYWESGWAGVTVLGHAGAGWPAAGPAWPVHDYAMTNIRSDGTVPARPTPPWQAYNVYRARPAADSVARPDLRGQIRDLCVSDCVDGPVRISVQVENVGGEDLPAGAPWALYRSDSSGDTLVFTGALPALPAGVAAEGFVIELRPEDVGDAGFFIALDDDGSGQGQVEECDEGNNLIHGSDGLCP